MEFSHVGDHCSVSSCNQKDFLPFTCDCCKAVFCLEHRSYQSHDCPLSGLKDTTVIECPMCNGMIQMNAAQDANAAFAAHQNAGKCDPSRNVKKKKERCSAQGCKEVLLTSNKVYCSKCRRNYCLRHRFVGDHSCTGSTRPTNNTRAAKQIPKPKKKIQASNNSCPICAKEFQYVSQLIAHVDRAHVGENDDNGSGAAANEFPETCPTCNATFRTVQNLIHHVEHAHNQEHHSESSCIVM